MSSLLALTALLACRSSSPDSAQDAETAASIRTPVADLTLTDVGLEAGIQDRYRRNRGLAVADFDGDGDPDLFLGNPSDETTLYLNQGDGTFVVQDDTPTTGMDTSASAADYDGDGDPDLLLTCGGWILTCADKLYRNDGVDAESGEIVLTDVSDTAGIGLEERPGFGAAWADYDLDGDLDVFVSNKLNWFQPDDDHQDQLYRNEGDGTFTEVARQAGVDDDGDNHQSSWIDVDEDGDPDLYVPTLLGDNKLYINQGDGTFSNQTPEDMKVPYQAFGSAVMDLDNDGHLDLVVSATTGGAWLEEDNGDEPVAYLGRGDGTFEASPLSEGLPDGVDGHVRVMGYQVGDLDMDGYPDLFFGQGEPVSGWTNLLLTGGLEDGNLAWTDRTALIDGPATEDGDSEPYNEYPYRTHATVMFDYDGDGDVDLFVGNGGMGMNLAENQDEPNRLFRNDTAPAANFVRLDLRGTTSNRDAVGSLVRITPTSEPDRTVTRFLTRSTGFNSSLPRVQVVGLGDRPPPYTVDIRWPTGITETVTVEQTGTTLTMEESAR